MDDPADPLDVLARRAQAGDREAFSAIVVQTEVLVRRFIAARATSLSQVDEVLQETYVTAWIRISSYRLSGTLLAWLKGIARNLQRQEWERCRAAAATDPECIDGLIAPEPERDLDADVSTAMRRRLRSCLETLSIQLRDLIQRRYQGGQSMTDLGATLACPAATVATRLFRAREHLRACIERGAETP
ncbi:RNA polymerase sigma factor [Planctomycetota bacterium]|nr:RNA polymerase sigma factor [Planctomycetota bacterium]